MWDSRLREKSYGEVEGRPAGHDQRFVAPPALGDRMNHDDGVPGAETRAVFAKRVYAAMADVLDRSGDHQIVVTHGGATTFVVAAWIRMPIESLGYVKFTTPPGSITTLHEDDVQHDRQVVRLADTSHLTSRL